jgi:hypothetical protein
MMKNGKRVRREVFRAYPKGYAMASFLNATTPSRKKKMHRNPRAYPDEPENPDDWKEDKGLDDGDDR